MKKIMVIVCVLMLLTVSAFAAGNTAGLDLAAYTLDELVEIRNAITSEINERLGNGAADEMYMGEYVVGVHIKAGTYLLSCSSDSDFFSFHWYENDSKERDALICNETLMGEAQYYVELTDGMMLYVYNGKGTVTPWSKPSWAP